MQAKYRVFQGCAIHAYQHGEHDAGRRRLLAESIRVETSVKAADKEAANSMSVKLARDSINRELAAAGLPAATVLEVYTEAADGEGGSTSTSSAKRSAEGVPLMAIIGGGVGALVLTLACAAFCCMRRNRESSLEEGTNAMSNLPCSKVVTEQMMQQDEHSQMLSDHDKSRSNFVSPVQLAAQHDLSASSAVPHPEAATRSAEDATEVTLVTKSAKPTSLDITAEHALMVATLSSRETTRMPEDRQNHQVAKRVAWLRRPRALPVVTSDIEVLQPAEIEVDKVRFENTCRMWSTCKMGSYVCVKKMICNQAGMDDGDKHLRQELAGKVKFEVRYAGNLMTRPRSTLITDLRYLTTEQIIKRKSSSSQDHTSGAFTAKVPSHVNGLPLPIAAEPALRTAESAPQKTAAQLPLAPVEISCSNAQESHGKSADWTSR